MAKGKLVKIIATIASIAVIAGGSIFAYNAFVKGPGSTTPVGPGTTEPGPGPIVAVVQLETPEQVSFNGDNYVLSWDEVDNASAYTIYYNGEEKTVDADDTQEQITITAEENVFKVKAVGDGSYYTDSEWSNEITYTIDNQQEEQSVYEKVNLKLAQEAQAKGLKLESVIGISYINPEGNNYGDNIIFQTICSKDGVSSNYELVFSNPGYTSTQEILENFESATLLRSPKDKIVDYDTIQYLLDSGSFDGRMEELSQQGYEITAINSFVKEGKKVGSKFRFEIVGTYRADRNGEVIFFTSTNRIDILTPSSNEIRNYQDSVEFVDYRTVTEIEFLEHKDGETLGYMGEWAVKNAESSTSANDRIPTSASRGTVNSDDGLEM